MEPMHINADGSFTDSFLSMALSIWAELEQNPPKNSG
jgi:hypothetical protein